jgi:hypothetical protein
VRDLGRHTHALEQGDALLVLLEDVADGEAGLQQLLRALGQHLLLHADARRDVHHQVAQGLALLVGGDADHLELAQRGVEGLLAPQRQRGEPGVASPARGAAKVPPMTPALAMAMPVLSTRPAMRRRGALSPSSTVSLALTSRSIGAGSPQRNQWRRG